MQEAEWAAPLVGPIILTLYIVAIAGMMLHMGRLMVFGTDSFGQGNPYHDEKYLPIIKNIYKDAAYANTLKPRVLRKAAKYIRTTFPLILNPSYETVLIRILASDNCSSKTAEWVWENIADPSIQDAVLQCKNLSDEKKALYALDRLANPSVQIYDFF